MTDEYKTDSSSISKSGLKNQERFDLIGWANALKATNTDSISGRGKSRTHAPDNNDESGSSK